MEPLLSERATARLIFRHLPLPQHEWAQAAAQASACAQFQSGDAFWKLHGTMFLHQREFTPDNADNKITELAAGINALNHAQFEQCRSRQMSLGLVLRDKEIAARIGVRSTPTIFLNGNDVSSIRDPAEFHRAIEKAVGNPGLRPKPVKESNNECRFKHELAL